MKHRDLIDRLEYWTNEARTALIEDDGEHAAHAAYRASIAAAALIHALCADEAQAAA